MPCHRIHYRVRWDDAVPEGKMFSPGLLLKHLSTDVEAPCLGRLRAAHSGLSNALRSRVEPPAPPTDDLFAQNPEELDD